MRTTPLPRRIGAAIDRLIADDQVHVAELGPIDGQLAEAGPADENVEVDVLVVGSVAPMVGPAFEFDLVHAGFS